MVSETPPTVYTGARGAGRARGGGVCATAHGRCAARDYMVRVLSDIIRERNTYSALSVYRVWGESGLCCSQCDPGSVVPSEQCVIRPVVGETASPGAGT